MKKAWLLVHSINSMVNFDHAGNLVRLYVSLKSLDEEVTDQIFDFLRRGCFQSSFPSFFSSFYSLAMYNVYDLRKLIVGEGIPLSQPYCPEMKKTIVRICVGHVVRVSSLYSFWHLFLYLIFNSQIEKQYN